MMGSLMPGKKKIASVQPPAKLLNRQSYWCHLANAIEKLR